MRVVENANCPECMETRDKYLGKSKDYFYDASTPSGSLAYFNQLTKKQIGIVWSLDRAHSLATPNWSFVPSYTLILRYRNPSKSSRP